MSERAMEATQQLGQPSNLNLNYTEMRVDAAHPDNPGSWHGKRLGIIAGIFAAEEPMQSDGVPQVGAGSAKILIQVMGQFPKNFFKLRGGGADKNDITGGSVHIGQTAAAKFPKGTDVFQIFCGIVFAAG